MKVETDAVLVVFLKVSRDGAEVTSATRKAECAHSLLEFIAVTAMPVRR